LGEHGSWSKHTNFEIDTRVPLIVSVPAMRSAGKHSSALVESVDIYPTLCELCGLKFPDQAGEGISFASVLADPYRKWKNAAFSQYPRYLTQTIMGYSMRSERYRYTEWKDVKNGNVLARELYDHQIDPSENVNAASLPVYAAAIKELEQLMKQR
jgi:iduronate 2-sulfatase